MAQNWVHFTWEDGLTWRAFGTFLRENEVVDGIVSDLTREREVEIDRLPSGIPESAEIDPFGNVAIRWTGGHESHYSGGWIRDMAEGRWSPDADLPKIVPWTTKDLSEPPSFSGPEMFRDATEMEAFLTACWRSGLARLRGLPSKDGTVQRVAEAIGTVRNSNFGFLFSVETKPDPDSNAYRAVSLDAHTDLATRETQPGFQLLHCQENSSTGGESTMVDGFAVAQAIRADDQDAYNALADLKWVFTNRHRDTDYRWSGPIIETSSSGDPIEIRNTGFLRFFPDMAEADIPRAYAALTKFTALCSDTHFQMATPFTAGDLVMFDNRRVLHGRNGFDRQSGIRRLQGCYLDRDEVASRLRVLARSRRAG
ncbi:MAG: TauD/TfdA family dioxygenase [Pseudomonadota bacterium]